MMDDPVHTASSNEKNRFDSLEYSIISEASLLRTADSALMYCTNCSSTHPRVSWDDVETTNGFAKPSSSDSNSLSIPMDVPKPAADPTGTCLPGIQPRKPPQFASTPFRQNRPPKAPRC